MAEKLTHVGFIADGNRRWAKERGLPTLEGHRKGSDKVELIVEELRNSEVDFVSFFVFSTENWDRSTEEVNYLMKLIGDSIERLTKKAKDENIRVVLLGRPERVEPKLWQRLMDAEQSTAGNTGLTVCFCFNYGGQWEIADAAKKAAAAGETDYSPENFRKYIYHPEVPDCDLVVRTSGEQRTSGFQLWRAAYSELLFLDKYFPAIEKEDVQAVLDEYHRRHRRFGK